ncbi:B3/B4 domain-containing protein [Alkalihalobacillus sp. CinArs1]|uniref:B3/B4 domain-containing protein n=1 Tax=Alkalihalobacillus sp. CinArs1 TaxID=2995314 RepID=UPI0022DDDB47|nr:phenylalanine--tRNA ligase beta subunit-related protein [Alkalihalobacillus sp. CinArs1]
MTNISLSTSITEILPDFKIGWITYHDIVVENSPQMVRGRYQFYLETMMMDLEDAEITSFQPVKEWRTVFKKLGTDPSRYRPSSEALLRRLKKGSDLPRIHSAADINNLLSLQYKIPIGIYDLDKVEGSITILLGDESTTYQGLNGREVNFTNKLVSLDEKGPFGSPIVDSERTAVTEETTNAIQLYYIQPSLSNEEANKLLQASGEMFNQIHGGDFNYGLAN